MRIVHKDISNPIIINETKINILVLENKKFFIDKINELINQINGDYRTCTNKLDTKFKINNLRNYILFDKV